MAPRRLTADEAAFVEWAAQTRRHFESVVEDQMEVLSKHEEAADRATTAFEKQPQNAKPGQQWEPSPDELDAYLAECNEKCTITPHTIEE